MSIPMVPRGRRAGPTVSASTRVFALLGDPVSRSLSPLLQNAAFRAAGVDAVYVALRCLDGELPGLMRGIARGGGGGNVTLPHKERAAALLDVPSQAVLRSGACNTFWGEGGRIHGDNTDIEGFRRALRAFLPGSAGGYRVLLLGAGGAARAVLVALLDEGVAEVAILNRTQARARAVARSIGGERLRVAGGLGDIEGEEFDLIVNATRPGAGRRDPPPIDPRIPGRVGAFMDLVYSQRDTPLVTAVRKMGVQATDGREMLVHQGAAAFERWWAEPAPLEAMKEAVRAVRAC